MEYKKDGLVAMVGHPGTGATDGGKMPLRLSYGIEKSFIAQTIFFDYDSLGGNSGSPVIGRGHKSTQLGRDKCYMVKGYACSRGILQHQ